VVGGGILDEGFINGAYCNRCNAHTINQWQSTNIMTWRYDDGLIIGRAMRYGDDMNDDELEMPWISNDTNNNDEMTNKRKDGYHAS